MITRFIHPILLLWLLLGVVIAQEAPNDETCAEKSSLQPMTFDVGHGPETTLVYSSPDVSTFYQQPSGSRKVVKPRFTGLAAKFINISPSPVTVFYDPGQKRELLYIADIGPFEAAATAAYPTHVFVVTDKVDRSKELTRFTVTPDNMLYVYDPIQDPVNTLSKDELELYTLQKENLVFAKQYRNVTGREWLSLFPKRERPHPMWNADYFGQQHWITTTETHFESFPPQEHLTPIGMQEQRRLSEYRSSSPELNLTLTVLSCEPRVFEIKNFLSTIEVDHIMELATGMKLHRSVTLAGASSKETTSQNTRTSRNTWVPRVKSPIVDAIYRRAADLLRMDEALLRRRTPDEHPELGASGSIAEDLQLVHYDVGQQYTPHHDWSIPRTTAPHQPARYATILLYLNDDMEGGETAFPKYKNADSGSEIQVKPKVGKAVLFYSLLPDGNFDELSEHAALPVRKGEKWLTNLWVWDPTRRGL